MLNYQQDIDLLKKKLVALNAELKDKIDADLFDQEINSLKSMLKNQNPANFGNSEYVAAAPLNSSNISTKDLNKMKDLFEKFPVVEDAQNNLLKELKKMNIPLIRE